MTPRQNESKWQSSRANRLLSRLRDQLQHFSVRDRQGELFGTVQDLQFNPEGHFDVIVAPLPSQPNSSSLVVGSQLIQKIDSSTRSLLLDLPLSELVHLPRTLSMDTAPFSSAPLSDVSATQDATIPLLEERLVVNSSRRKIGEVVVRKEIETYVIQVPVRREKLIVEQVSPERKQLAAVDLGEDTMLEGALSFQQVTGASSDTVRAEFTSLDIAGQVLEAIASQPNSGCQGVRIELLLNNPQLKETYQNWLANYQ